MKYKAASGRRWVGATEELTEEEAACGEDAAVRVHQPSLNTKRDIAERLPVNQQV